MPTETGKFRRLEMGGYQIRKMTEKEAALAIDWAALEGWNPGLNDAEDFYTADPGGFLIGLLDGEPVATISAVKYGETFGFIGLYIVKPQYRGRGYGLALWNAAMEYLKGRNAGLDGVVARQADYEKSGFRYAYRNVSYEGVCGGGGKPDGRVVELSGVAFSEVNDYDRLFFPETRTQFLKKWIVRPGGASLGARVNGRLAGYGVIRPCGNGYKIGPLFADTADLAQSLFSALTARAQTGAPVFLDIPEVNPEAAALAKRHKMKVVFETARMYKGKFPELPMDKLFGVTTFELG